MTRAPPSGPTPTQRQARGRWWLVGAALLLALAAGLMFYGEKEQPAPARAEVNMPRRLRSAEVTRMEGRRVLPVPAAVPTSGPPAPQRPRDPVLAALAAPGLKSAVVIEANALRFSPVGQLLIDCLNSDPENNPLEQLKKKAGIDALQDVDRVAITEDGFLVSGKFDKARWDDVFTGGSRDAYGDSATLYGLPPRKRAGADPAAAADRPEQARIGTWNNQMVFLSDSAEGAKQTVDRLEGRAPVGTPLINENQTYGEIYGVLSAADLAKLLPAEQAGMAERLKEAADRIELHVDTSKDVGVVAEIRGPDAAQVEDLGKSLGAAMALARLQAQAEGHDEAAQLMEMAKVVPSDGHFRLELAMPLPWLETQLKRCKEMNAESAARRKERAAARQGQPDQVEAKSEGTSAKPDPAEPEDAQDEN